MSYCKLHSERFQQFTTQDIDNSAYDLNFLLCMKNVSAQFVSKEEYQKLLFILGFKDYNFNTISQDYRTILTLMNDFSTSTVSNFKHMLHQMQFPFVYDEKRTLAENRKSFKDFFSYLTKIRCAVIEGSH